VAPEKSTRNILGLQKLMIQQ